MKTIFFYILLILLLLSVFITSCKKGEHSDLSLKCYNVEKAIYDKPIELCIDSISSEISVIPLETSDDILIKGISSVYLYLDFLFIIHTERSRCSVFDLKGKYLYDIGNRGNGPGEFLDITCMFFSVDDVGICDFLQKKIYYYSITGKFKNEVRMFTYLRYIKKINKNTFAGIMETSRDESNNRIIFFNLEGNVTDSIQYSAILKPIPGLSFFDDVNLFTYKNNHFFVEGYSDTIFRISDKLKLIPEYIMTTGKYAVSHHDRQVNFEKYRVGKRTLVIFENDLYILSGHNNYTSSKNYLLINKKTDKIENVILKYNEEMTNIFADDWKMLGRNKYESLPVHLQVNGVSEDGSIILSYEYLKENEDDNPVIVMVKIND
jgi:hypothetical protein